jgi:hypothetical protein
MRVGEGLGVGEFAWPNARSGIEQRIGRRDFML